jgi:hypothetical protein
MGRAITPQVSKVQETGYKYFAESGDSNLVRVVQYAAMYQIFSAFNVARSTQPMAKDPYPSQRIETLTGELLAKLNRSSDKELDEMTERVTPILLGEMVDEELAQKERKEDEAEKKKISADLRKGGLTPDSAGYKIEFDNRFRAFKDGQARRFELSRKLFLQLGKEEVKKELVAIKQNRAAKNDDEGLRRQTLSAVAAVENLPKNYADEIAQRAEQAKVWIHTPVVVLSRNKSSNYVGGHNLDARVTKVVADKTVPAGEVKIDSRGIVVNPADVPRARAMVRSIESQDLMLELARAARENNVAKFYSVQMQMRAELNRAELAAVRPPNAALHLSSPPPPRPPNKPPISTGEPPPAGGSGWGGGERNPLLIVGDARKEDFIRFKSQADGRHAVEYGDANAKEVFGKASLTHEDAVDLAIVAAVRRVRNGEPVIVEFEGLPQQKAIATLHTMEIRMGERGQDVQLVGFIRGDGGALMTGATFARRYNVIKGRVEVSDVRVSTSGELLQEVSLTVPAVDPAGSAAKFTSEITFNRRTPRAVIEAVRARVVRAYEGLKTSWSRRLDARRFAADVNEYNRDLARAVKKIKTRTKLRFDVKTKLDFDVDQRHLRDSFISEKGHANGERPPLSATSQSE